MRRAQGSVMGFGKVASLALGSLGVTFGAAAVVGGVVKLGHAVADFNSKMTNSLAIMGDVGPALRREMGDAAIDVSKVTQFSAAQAAESYYFLASAGLDAAQSIKAMPAVAQFAQAGMFDLALATDLLTDAQSALGLSVKDAGQNLTNMKRVSDVLIKANTLANASAEQFSTSLTNKAGAALRILGKDVEEGVAVLAAFADQGVKGEEAGTALNIVLRDLATAAINNKEAFAQANVAVFDSAGEMRNVADIVGDLEGALAGLSDEGKKATMMQLGFTDKSIAFAQALIGTSDKIRGYEAALRDAGGTTAEVADKQMGNLSKAWNELKGQAIDLAVKFSPVLDALAALIDLIAVGVQALDKMAEALGSLLPDDFAETVTRGGQRLHDFFFGASDAAAKGADGMDQFGQAANRSADQVVKGADAVAQFAQEAKSAGDAADEVETKLNKLKDAGERLTEQLRTPAEVFADTMAEFDELLDAGAISWETYSRAVQKATGDLESATDAKTDFDAPRDIAIGAAVRGTSGGFSAAQAGQRQSQRLQEIAEKQRQEAAKQTKLLEEINKRLAEKQPVTKVSL